MKPARLLLSFLFFFLSTRLPAQEIDTLLILFYQGAYRDVISRAESDIETGKATLNTYHLKILSEIQTGQNDRALRSAEQALKIFPGNRPIEKLLAGQLFESGLYNRAGFYYRKFAEEDSSDLSSWLRWAEIAAFRQDYREAEHIHALIYRQDSLNLENLLSLADILSKQNDSTAILYYEKALAIQPYNQQAAYALGSWYLKLHQPGMVIEVCRPVLEEDSTNIRFLKQRGFAYYRSGNISASVSDFTLSENLGDSSVFTWKYLGIDYYLAVDIDKAIEYLTNAVNKDSLDAEIHFFLGSSLGNTTRKERALYHLGRSAELMQPDPYALTRIYSEMGNIMRLQCRYREAYESYKKAWRADTTNALPVYYMASILDNSLHELNPALQDYRIFIELLDSQTPGREVNPSLPTIRTIVEDRILSITEELFFRDEQ